MVFALEGDSTITNFDMHLSRSFFLRPPTGGGSATPPGQTGRPGDIHFTILRQGVFVKSKFVKVLLHRQFDQVSFHALYTALVVTVPGGARAAYHPVPVFPKAPGQAVHRLPASQAER